MTHVKPKCKSNETDQNQVEEETRNMIKIPLNAKELNQYKQNNANEKYDRHQNHDVQNVDESKQENEAMESKHENKDIILVTGGAGFVGGHIAQQLLFQGYAVVVYDIFNSENTPTNEKEETATMLQETAIANRNKDSSLKIIKGDICDTEHLRSVIQKERITACFHMACVVNDRRSVLCPFQFIDVNIKGTVNLLQILAENNVQTVVQASTRSVFGERADTLMSIDEKSERLPINPYGATKVAMDAFAHVYAHLYHMNIALVRISATYGPRGRKDMIPRICIDNIHAGIPINKFGDGSATRSWV